MQYYINTKMEVCTCFLLFGFFAYTHSTSSYTPKSNERSVKLALETVLEFNNKDKEIDLKFLNNVQNFITKVKTVIDENSNGNNLRRNLKVPSVKTFTGFIQDVIRILNTYEVSDFVKFFDILDEEIRNYHYRGCKFYELTENYEIRKLIAAKLDSFKSKPTFVKKMHMNTFSYMMKYEKYDRNVKEFLDYINSLYKREVEEVFHKVISDLEAYGSTKSNSSNNNLRMIIKNGVRCIVFDHYTNLNPNVRRDLKEKIEIFWQQTLKNSPAMGNIPVARNYSKYNNVKNFKSVIEEVMESKPYSRKDLMDIASKKANKKIELNKIYENNIAKYDISQAEYEKEMKPDDVNVENKLYKNSRKDTDAHSIHTQEKYIRLSSQHNEPIDQPTTKDEHQEYSTSDILSGNSFSSIEIYHEPQDNTTQYTAIIPIKMSQKPPMNVSNKLEEIEALNMKTRMTSNTVKQIWIEESTGILPKAVLDKLTVKSNKHESRYNMTEDSLNKHSLRHNKKYDKDQKKWHGKTYKPKYVKSYEKTYGKKHDKSQMTKRHLSKIDTKYESKQKHTTRHKRGKNVKTSEPKNPFILVHNRDYFRQNYMRTTGSVFNMEVYKYRDTTNTSSKPLGVELKLNKRLTTASTKAQKFLVVLDALMPSKTAKTTKSSRVKRTESSRAKLNVIKRKIKRKQTSPHAPTGSSRRRSVAVPRAYSQRNIMIPWNSADHSSSFSEGMSLEKYDRREDRRRHGQNSKTTPFSIEKDPFVIERIKNLERQFNEIKSKMNVNTDVVKARQVKHRFMVTDNILKPKQSKIKLRSNLNLITNDFKEKRDKFRMAETADKKTEPIIKYNNITEVNSTIREIGNDFKNSEKAETNFRSISNMTSSDSKDSTDNTNPTQTADNKVDEKNIHLKIIDEMINNDHQTMELTNQQALHIEDKKIETNRINIAEITPTAQDREAKIVINDHDERKETVNENRKVSSPSTSTKATESTTKTTTNVQLIVAVTALSTLKSSTISFTTSPKPADILKIAEINAKVNESENQKTNNTVQVADVSKTTLNATNEIDMNHKNDVIPTTSNYQEYLL